MVFFRYPEIGQVLRQLADSVGPETACRLHALMVSRTLVEASRVAGVARYVFFDPPERADEVDQWLMAHGDAFALAAQGDGDMGGRMRAALHRVFSRNTVRRAVVCGTDCPTVNQVFMESAFAALDRAQAVIGPTDSGGCCLLGMTRPMPFLFDEVDWGEGRVLEPILRTLRRHGIEPALLPVGRRVETVDDLETMWPNWRDEVAG